MGRVECIVPNISTINAGKSDSSGQLVGSAPQLAGQVNRKGGADTSPAPLAGAVQPHGRLPKSQGARVDGGGSYPLPCIQEALESMAGLAQFSSMDLKSGF